MSNSTWPVSWGVAQLMDAVITVLFCAQGIWGIWGEGYGICSEFPFCGFRQKREWRKCAFFGGLVGKWVNFQREPRVRVLGLFWRISFSGASFVYNIIPCVGMRGKCETINLINF